MWTPENIGKETVLKHMVFNCNNPAAMSLELRSSRRTRVRLPKCNAQCPRLTERQLSFTRVSPVTGLWKMNVDYQNLLCYQAARVCSC